MGLNTGLVVVTHRLVAGYFHMRSRGELALKGKAEPVGAWEVISARIARTRLEVEAERGLTPFVGRERELQLLFECFEQAKAGHGQVVFIAGEAGIGKSRLLLEFRRRLSDEATWIEGRSMSFGRSMAFHPLIDLLRRNFRIEESDTEEMIVAKVGRSVLRLGEDLRPFIPYLRYLLSVDPGDATVLAMDRALDLNQQSAEGARKRGDHEVIANAELNLGDAFLAQGDLGMAQEYLDAVHRLVNDPATSEWNRWRYSTHLFASLENSG